MLDISKISYEETVLAGYCNELRIYFNGPLELYPEKITEEREGTPIGSTICITIPLDNIDDAYLTISIAYQMSGDGDICDGDHINYYVDDEDYIRLLTLANVETTKRRFGTEKPH